MGHCNVQDILALEKDIDGMKVSDKSDFNCDTCTLGKMPEYRNRNPDRKASKLFELVHCDLAGTIEPVACEGFKYCLMVDDYSGVSMVYFLKAKSDTCEATKKFFCRYCSFCANQNVDCVCLLFKINNNHKPFNIMFYLILSKTCVHSCTSRCKTKTTRSGFYV